MARARKCDRCGRLYETYPGAVNKKLEFNHIVLRDVDERDDYFNRKKYDLCPPCSSELEEWFLNAQPPLIRRKHND